MKIKLAPKKAIRYAVSDLRAQLLGAEFSLLPAEVVAVAFSAAIRSAGVTRSTVSANLVVQPNLLRQLFLHDISDGHR